MLINNVYKENEVNSKLAIRRIKPYLNKDMVLLFYNSYIFPIYDYGLNYGEMQV